MAPIEITTQKHCLICMLNTVKTVKNIQIFHYLLFRTTL